MFNTIVKEGKVEERSILIVEDNDNVRASLRDWLQIAFADCRVYEASSGEEAITSAHFLLPDIILMDIGLPGINGIETMCRIKKFAPQIDVVIITIHDATRYQTEALESGASAYVIKRKMYNDLFPTLTRLLHHDSAQFNNKDRR